jgi:putative Mg2+ transporter-C (MgtC) family protein
VEFSFSPLAGIAGAAVLGGAIGLQRQAAAKPAGFRTHLLVATAAAAFTAMGAHLHDTRIPSYIVVGIGFLGSGAIVRQGVTPHGLTTAASIWMAAAIGLVMGYSNSFGLYIALLATAITILALVLSDTELLRLFRINRKATIRITSISPRISTAQITQAFHDAQVHFENSDIVSIESDGAEEILQLVYLLDVPPGRDLSAIVRQISALSGVRKVECEEPFFGG